jgi:hypothetical protein
VPSFKLKKRKKKMYSQVLTSTPKKVTLEKARKKKKKRKKIIYRKRLFLHTMTFEEQILHVQDITPMIRKTEINSMNLDIFTEEDFLPSTTTGCNCRM